MNLQAKSTFISVNLLSQLCKMKGYLRSYLRYFSVRKTHKACNYRVTTISYQSFLGSEIPGD